MEDAQSKEKDINVKKEREVVVLLQCDIKLKAEADHHINMVSNTKLV